MENTENQTVENNTVEMKPKVTPKTGQKQEKKLSQTEIRLRDANQKIEYLAHYIGELEKGVANIRNMLTTALIINYKETFKDCPKIKEEDVTETNYQEYSKIVGTYYMKDDEVVRIVPIQEGWKMDDTKPPVAIEYDEEVVNENNEVTGTQPTKGYTVSFKFEGITPDADYPTEFQCNAVNFDHAMTKLKKMLHSLKKKIIV